MYVCVLIVCTLLLGGNKEIYLSIYLCVDSDEPLQPPFRLRNSKWCSVSSLTIIEC